MAKKSLVLFEMPSEQFRKDIEAKVRNKLVYPKLPKKPKDAKPGAKEPLELRVVIELDESGYNKLAKDTVLHQETKDALLPIYARCCEAIAAVYEQANAMFEANIFDGDKALEDAWNKGKDKIKAAVDEMGAAANAVWAKAAKREKEYAQYQAKIVCTLVIAGMSLTAGIAIVASTPFHLGVGTIFGFIGMAKSSVVILKEVNSALKEPLEVIESAEKLFVKLFAGVEGKDKKFKKSWKAEQYTAEVMNTATNVFIGLEPLPSLKKLLEKLKLAKSKLQGVENKIHKIGKKIGDYAQRLETYEKVTKPKLAKMIAEKDLSGGFDPVAMELYMATVADKTEQKLAAHFTKLEKLQTEFNGMKERLDALNELVELMLEKPDVKNLKRFGALMSKLGFVANLGTAAASAGTDASTAGDIANIVTSVAFSDLPAEAVGKIVDKAAAQFTKTVT